MSSSSQPGISAPLCSHGRYLFFSRVVGRDAKAAVAKLASRPINGDIVIGLGRGLLEAIGSIPEGMRDHPVFNEAGASVPSTPVDLWIWLRGDDRGELLLASRKLEKLLAGGLRLDSVVESFVHRDSRDLSGYVDGTENPTGDRANEVAFVSGQGPGLDGASFVAVQKWQHDFDAFYAMSEQERDHCIGRRLSDNEEIDEAPTSAHVKRTAQESFSPEAFVLRRSMPWSAGQQAGLLFVAFGKSFDAYEALLGRMVGREDGVTDALFGFTRPISGCYFWCPPQNNGQLDLSAIDL
jgi:putative iron-dependent peroxidase